MQISFMRVGLRTNLGRIVVFWKRNKDRDELVHNAMDQYSPFALKLRLNAPMVHVSHFALITLHLRQNIPHDRQGAAR